MMKSKVFILCFTILLSFGQIIFGQEKGVGNRTVSKLPAKEKRWALIIGVGQYEDGNITPLPGANNDAKALRDALRDYAGFDEKQIISLTTDESKDRQPTKNNILRYLGNLSGTVPKDGLLLVAFSGHGIERQKQAFLLASDTPYNDNVRVLERTAISVSDDFKELVRDTGVGQVIILLDACRNDPSSGRSSSDNPLTQAYKDGFSFDVRNREVEAFATLYATSIGERAYEYTREGKGYFTWAFIEGLKGGAANGNGEVTLGALIRYVEKYVPQQVKIDLGSNKLQRPFSIIEGYKAEQLVLGITKKPNSVANSTSTVAKNSEAAFWQTIENNTDAKDFENYLARSRSGEFVGIYKAAAELKLLRLKKETAPTDWTNLRGLARILLKYDDVSSFSEGMAKVQSAEIIGKYGFIDETGKEITPLKYINAYSFSEGLAMVRVGYNEKEKYGFVDKTGKEIIPLKYKNADSFSEGLAAVDSGKAGFIDKTGKKIIPFKYKQARSFSEGLAPVELPTADSKYSIYSKWLPGVWGFIDKTGKEIISIKYDNALSFSEGLAAVMLHNKWGFIDKTGKEIIPFKYENPNSFSEGLAAVRTGDYTIGKAGFIDKTGKEIIPFKYDYALSFSEGLAEVRIGGFGTSKAGLIDKTGKEVVPIKYDKIWCYAFLKEGFVGVVLNGKKGFVDIYGNEYFDF